MPRRLTTATGMVLFTNDRPCGPQLHAVLSGLDGCPDSRVLASVSGTHHVWNSWTVPHSLDTV